jgi:hypothetical protein
MKLELLITETFQFSNGNTILVAKSAPLRQSVSGKNASLVNLDDGIQYEVRLIGERFVKAPSRNLDECVIETADRVFLSETEVKAGKWCLILEETIGELE